jgi:hypothetical protein
MPRKVLLSLPLVLAVALLAACDDEDDNGAAPPGIWIAMPVPVGDAETSDAGFAPGPAQLVVMDTDGTIHAEIGAVAAWMELSWSPDGSVLFGFEVDRESADGEMRIHLFRPFGGEHRQVTVAPDERMPGYAFWSHDGDRAALVGGMPWLWVVDRDGETYGGTGQSLEGGGTLAAFWAPDDTFIATFEDGLAVYDPEGELVGRLDRDELLPGQAPGGPGYLRWVDSSTFEAEYRISGGPGELPPPPEQQLAVATYAVDDDGLHLVDATHGDIDTYVDRFDLMRAPLDAYPRDDGVVRQWARHRGGFYDSGLLALVYVEADPAHAQPWPRTDVPLSLVIAVDGDIIDVPLGFTLDDTGRPILRDFVFDVISVPTN